MDTPRSQVHRITPYLLLVEGRVCEAEVITITQRQTGRVLNRFFIVHEFTIDIKMIIKANLSVTSSPSSYVDTVS